MNYFIYYFLILVFFYYYYFNTETLKVKCRNTLLCQQISTLVLISILNMFGEPKIIANIKCATTRTI